MVADHYHGAAAVDYEAKRQHRPPWAEEQALVAELVRTGPVLDVPIGTGRYLDIYRSKALAVVGCDLSEDMLAQARRRDPALVAHRGSIFALPFPDLSFATVVCTRLLNWFQPDDMRRALAELRRVAHEIVLSIRLGAERQWGTYTHGETTFRRAIDGLLVDARRTIREEGAQGIYTMFRLRRAIWGDVVWQFAWSGGAAKAVKLADEWADRYGMPRQDYASRPIRAEHWDRVRLARTIQAMASVEPRITAAGSAHVALHAPRRDDGPLVMLRFGDRYGMIDGRHRAHQWSQREGVYPVLVVECSSS